MDEPFELPVIYKNKELFLPARLLLLGYLHKFQVQVKEHEILFEPDEEMSYRAVMDPEQAENSKMDIELLKAIAEAIEAVTR